VGPGDLDLAVCWAHEFHAEATGYATAVVADLASLILSEGREFCALYADLANPTSNKIYREIGFMPRADVVEIDLISGEATGGKTG
jgi:predicted GNAT family acetyltransferase